MIIKTLIIDKEKEQMDIFTNELEAKKLEAKKEEIRISELIDEMIKLGAKEDLFNDKK